MGNSPCTFTKKMHDLIITHSFMAQKAPTGKGSLHGNLHKIVNTN